MRKGLRSWVVLCAAMSAPAMALTVDGGTTPYAGIFGIYEISDANRAADNGYGFQLTAGLPLSERASVEFSYLGIQRDRNLDGRLDYKNALTLDYLHDFGFYKFGGDLLPAFKPYVLAGLLGVEEDVLGDKSFHPGLDAGAGLLLPLKFGNWDWGWSLRSEARVFAQYNDRDTQPADRQVLVDYHFQVGLQIPLSLAPYRSRSAPAHEAGCELSVVNPVTGRSDCLSDSDRDGVADGDDQCPDTAFGTKVDEQGCAAATGGDSDADGVLDGDDLCPNTASGLTVDAKGCAVEQTLVLQSVNFENDSAVLTGQATQVLDMIAQSLNGQKNVRFEIGGHTDNSGTPAYNLLLSQQRAEAVRQYLIGKGVDSGRLSTAGYGETQPIADNANAEGRASNRRVEFRIVLN